MTGQLFFRPEVAQRIQNAQKPGYVLVLDFEDGSGPFNQQALSCSFDVNFSLLVVPVQSVTTAYPLVVTSNLGPVYTKNNTKLYLDSTIVFRQPSHTRTIRMQNDSGMISGNVPLRVINAATKPD